MSDFFFRHLVTIYVSTYNRLKNNHNGTLPLPDSRFLNEVPVLTVLQTVTQCNTTNFQYFYGFRADPSGRLPAGVAGSNPAGGVDVCLL
jgi:hypothetical protein